MDVLKTLLTLILITVSGTNNISGKKPRNLFFLDSLDVKDTVHGIDISFYQKKVQWHKLPNDICFVVIKATEGSKLKDTKFKENWDSAGKNGYIRGAYHFYRPYVTPYSQFRNFISVVKLKKGDLPPVVDAEIHSKYTKKLQNDLKIFLNLLERYYKVKPIIYCNAPFYRKHFYHSYFDQYHFWIADYRGKNLDSTMKMWDFWQYTCWGNVNGIKGYVDKNYYRWGYDSLKNICVK